MLRTSKFPAHRAVMFAFVGGFGLAAVAHAGMDSQGGRIYLKKCVSCHGKDGRGRTKFAEGRPDADLTDGIWKHGGTHADIVRLIAEGDRNSPMPPFRGRLSIGEIDAVARYVENLKRSAAPARPAPSR